jgi:hypothetical protein
LITQARYEDEKVEQAFQNSYRNAMTDPSGLQIFCPFGLCDEVRFAASLTTEQDIQTYDKQKACIKGEKMTTRTERGCDMHVDEIRSILFVL